MCGGTGSIQGPDVMPAGLSPRVRGNLSTARWLDHFRGSIPACAGEPPSSRRIPGKLPVYPRVCGGTPCRFPEGRLLAGLSPRVRGNHRDQPFLRFRPRSIPACAGEPPRWTRRCWTGSVYPRACGGTPYSNLGLPLCPGLSPRVRGNLPFPCCQCVHGGSIPARAGEPINDIHGEHDKKVYPRACGGTTPTMFPRCQTIGLSPRVRGNRHGMAWQ